MPANTTTEIITQQLVLQTNAHELEIKNVVNIVSLESLRALHANANQSQNVFHFNDNCEIAMHLEAQSIKEDNFFSDLNGFQVLLLLDYR